jgi:hypothetical protein
MAGKAWAFINGIIFIYFVCGANARLLIAKKVPYSLSHTTSYEISFNINSIKPLKI